MSGELKPGEILIAQCEACGEVFDPSSPEARAGDHTATGTEVDRRGYPYPVPVQCGPISERVVVGRDEHEAELTSLHVDNARLREALELVLKWYIDTHVGHGDYWEDVESQIRDALAGSPAGAFVSLAELKELEYAGSDAWHICPICRCEDKHALNCWLARKLETARGS